MVNMKKYKIVYKSEFSYSEEEFAKLNLDNEIQELIDQDSSEHSDKDTWRVEVEIC